MKKEYVSPEFEEIRIAVLNQMMGASTEDVIHDGIGEGKDW